jgi:hypothetical protein
MQVDIVDRDKIAEGMADVLKPKLVSARAPRFGAGCRNRDLRIKHHATSLQGTIDGMRVGQNSVSSRLLYRGNFAARKPII